MATSTKPASVSELDVVVDSDAHVTEFQSDFLPYLEDPFASMLNTEGDDWGYLSSFYPTVGYFTPMDMGKAKVANVRSPEDVQEGMDMLDTTHTVLTPTLNLYLGMVHHDELAVALARAYNEWLLDTHVDPSEGRYGAAIVAAQDPVAAAVEIDDRADEKGIAAILIPSSGVNPPLGDRRYDPIYEAAEDNGLPLMMHAGSSGMIKSFPTKLEGTKRWLSAHVPYHAMEAMMHLSTMLTQGVPVRYPDLDFVQQEAGLGWIPYFMHRFDAEYMGKRHDAPLLEKAPSEYIRDQFYFTSQPVEGSSNPTYVQQTVRMFEGENCLMFSSDYPHNDFDSSDELFNLLRSEFDADELANIYGQTAQEVFDF
ncbi:amidohydrolase 2 (plasmid) [halophilic archaeon DL31]|nr:amidohydrolase 2 [halophilic archaeon DL31]